MAKNPDPKLGPPLPSVDETRRRLTKAGLAAPAVLGALASRPVLGQSLHNCTPSGHISGFASPNPNGTICSSLGASPASYQSPSTWPDGFKDDSGNPLPFLQAPSQLPQSDRFRDAYVIKAGNAVKRSATVEEVLIGHYVGNNNGWALAVATGFADPGFVLGKEAIAACMSAVTRYPSRFPLSIIGVVDMFNSVIVTGGLDHVTDTAYWNRDEVIDYFKSLYSLL
jgi:hypothetical protein